MATEIHIARVFVNHCVLALNAGELDLRGGFDMAKWWTTELRRSVVDPGVQLHGGYGYMIEYPIAQAPRRRPDQHDLTAAPTEIKTGDHRPGPGI